MRLVRIMRPTGPRLQVVASRVRVIPVEAADEGERVGDSRNQAPICRPQVAAESLSESNVVRVVGSWEVAFAGKLERTVVQCTEAFIRLGAELDWNREKPVKNGRRVGLRQPIAPHVLTDDIRDLNR